MSCIDWYRTSFDNSDLLNLQQAFLNEHISQGPETRKFEEAISQILEVPYVVATTSGSVALIMSLMALGISKDDEVIVPNRTWIATPHSGQLLGAKIVISDVSKDRDCIDPNSLEEKITNQTRAIIPVHLNGKSCDMRAINAIANRYGIPVVEDACQAFYSKNEDGFLGTQSQIGCISFGIAKLISTGQGGAVITRDKGLYEDLKLIRNHGTTTNIDPVYSRIGCNFKFSDLLASIGISQLKKINKKVDWLKSIYNIYREGMKDLRSIKIVPVDIEKGEVPIYVEILCSNRRDLMNLLQTKGINARPSLPSLNTVAYLKSNGEYPNSEIYHNNALFVPCGPSQPLENVYYTINILNEFERLNEI